MHPLDIAILAVTGLSAIFGLWKGLIRMFLPVLGLLVGLVLGERYGKRVGELILGHPSIWQNFLGFAAVVLATLILTMIVTWLLRKFLSQMMLGWLDRIAGLIAGAIISLLFWFLILTVASQIPELKEIISGSAIASFLLKYVCFIL